MALASAEAILELELDPDHPQFMAILTRKQSIIASVLSAGARVTPGRFRGQDKDMMEDIIAEMRVQKEMLAALQ